MPLWSWSLPSAKIGGWISPDLPSPPYWARSAREFGRETLCGHPDRATQLRGGGATLGAPRPPPASSGVGKGSRVALFFANGIEWMIWWLAVSRIGALAVPLSTLYAPAELAKVVRLADIGLLAAPSRVLNIDVIERLETAFPELAGQTSGRLSSSPHRFCVASWSPTRTRTGHG